jgi:hypothetical protein
MSLIRNLLVASAAVGISLTFAEKSFAGVALGAGLDPAIASTGETGLIDKVWCNGWGCGGGWGWRRWGYRPWAWGGPAYYAPAPGPYWACPPGYHLGPYRRACWPN